MSTQNSTPEQCKGCRFNSIQFGTNEGGSRCTYPDKWFTYYTAEELRALARSGNCTYFRPEVI